MGFNSNNRLGYGDYGAYEPQRAQRQMISDIEPRGNNRRSSDLMPTQPGRAAIALPGPN